MIRPSRRFTFRDDQGQHRGSALISIIIPVYNAGRTLHRTLSSLTCIAPRHRDQYELIVVNDGSTDNSLAMIHEIVPTLGLENARIIEKPNGGSATARNQGLESATGEWLLLLDSDDEVCIDFVDEIRSNSDATSLLFAYDVLRGQQVLRSRPPMEVHPGAHLDVFTARNPLPVSSIVFRRNVVDYLMNESVRAGEDLLFWIENERIFQRVVRRVDVVATRIHVHGENKSANTFLRGQCRQLIAEYVLKTHRDRLSRIQRNNLLLQARIGAIQQGGAPELKAFFRVPCNPRLYLNTIVRSIFRTRFDDWGIYRRRATHEK